MLDYELLGKKVVLKESSQFAGMAGNIVGVATSELPIIGVNYIVLLDEALTDPKGNIHKAITEFSIHLKENAND